MPDARDPIVAIPRNKYKIARTRTAELMGEELQWYEFGRLIGIVIRDKIDNDFGFVVLVRAGDMPAYCVDVETSLDTADEATRKLFWRMYAMQAAVNGVAGGGPV